MPFTKSVKVDVMSGSMSYPVYFDVEIDPDDVVSAFNYYGMNINDILTLTHEAKLIFVKEFIAHMSEETFLTEIVQNKLNVTIDEFGDLV